MYISRRELKELGVTMTDEQWNNCKKQLADIEVEIWEAEHPLDD